MTPIPMAFPRPRKAPLMALAVLTAGLLSGCYLSDDDEFLRPATASQSPPAATTPAPATDAFVSYVSQVIANQDDTAQPQSVDGVVVTTPDDTTAPVPLTSA